MTKTRVLTHVEKDVPCGWDFTCGATSFVVKGYTFYDLLDNVMAHLNANNIIISREVVEAEIHEQLCDKLPESYWRYTDADA